MVMTGVVAGIAAQGTPAPPPPRRGATVTRVVIRVVQGGAPATILTYCR